MRNKLLILAFLLMAGAMVEPFEAAETESAGRLANRLCGALSAIQVGDRLPVVFEGILSPYFELHDPAELRCSQEVQPWTLVSISPQLERYSDLERLLKEDRGAFVRLSGELLGPERGADDNPDLSIVVASGLRFHGVYGPMASRTKLVVKSIERLQPLKDAAFVAPPGRQNPSPFPEVLKAEIPTRYPRHAWKIGLSGTVRAQVTVKEGKVAQVEILEGDRTFLEETSALIETWQFDPAVHARFTTTFAYRIENAPAGPARVRVVAQLPLRVEVATARDDW